jgi:hypothetical protein
MERSRFNGEDIKKWYGGCARGRVSGSGMQTTLVHGRQLRGAEEGIRVDGCEVFFRLLWERLLK